MQEDKGKIKNRFGEKNKSTGRKMKILLINPPRSYFKESMGATFCIPIGLLSVAAVLDKAGHDVHVLDTLAGAKTEEKGNLRYFGLTEKEIEEKIRQINPEIIGIGIQFTAQANNALQVAKIVKKVNHKTMVIVGGPDATVRGEALLKENKSLDICVAGEGERTVLELVNQINKKKSLRKIKGIFYRQKNKVLFTGYRPFIENLDELPLPAYHLANMKEYLSPNNRLSGRGDGKNLREISIVTSRGCPFNCIFCSIHLHMGRKWRANSVEYVLKHIEFLVKKYNVEHIHFEDDNMTFDKKRFEGILDGIIKRKLNFSWDTPNGIRADTLDDRITAKIKKTHCSALMIGVESGDKFVLEKIVDKRLNLGDVINAAKLCKKYNIHLNASFVMGFPGETKQNMLNTINFALMLKRKYDVNGEFLIAAPLYKTRLYDICKKDKLLAKELTPEALSKCEEGSSVIKTKDFTPEEVSMLRIYATKKMAEVKLINYARHPLETLGFVLKNPERVLRFIKRFQ